MRDRGDRIEWAPRVPPDLVRQMYVSAARVAFAQDRAVAGRYWVGRSR